MVINFIKYFIIFLINVGSFSFENLIISGRKGMNFNFSIEIDTMKGGINSSLYNAHPNENIRNNSYYFEIPVQIASQCDQGQYYDNSRFLSFNKIIIFLLTF